MDEAAGRLILALEECNAPQKLYREIVRWTQVATELGAFKGPGKMPSTRKEILRNLSERYNMSGLAPVKPSCYSPTQKQ